uniref:G-protein coupled receptors family 1 profile domain-containing protein n=1 Tax=Timema cristinae TaxID=61476 RepID=A0A7R9D615_TIMCR|nr:unnamed protein product [Timema cristinae]
MTEGLLESFWPTETEPSPLQNGSFLDYMEALNATPQSLVGALFAEAGGFNISDLTEAVDGGQKASKRDPLFIVVPITVIYALIFLLGIIGNVSTCIVIARNKHMHTATNYYLFSLAVSDMLLLVSGLPPEMYNIWSSVPDNTGKELISALDQMTTYRTDNSGIHFKATGYPYVFGEVFCVIQGFAAETSANATVLTITAFTVERYVAICHPFQSHTVSKLSRAVRFVVGIWLLALCLAVPQVLFLVRVLSKSVSLLLQAIQSVSLLLQTIQSVSLLLQTIQSVSLLLQTIQSVSLLLQAIQSVSLLLQAIQFGVVYLRTTDGSVDPETAMCTIKTVLVEHAFEISTFVFFVAPMTVISVLYVLIALKLRRSRLLTSANKRPSISSERGAASEGGGSTRGGHRGANNQNHVIRMLGE